MIPRPTRLCPFCDDPLPDDVEDAHPDCLSAWQSEIASRTCYLCGNALDEDAPPFGIHPDCETDP
jgi:hypothetical protein